MKIRLFDGVPEMLKTLKEAGRILCTASSKPEMHVRDYLAIILHITDYFDHICGATLDESRSGKKRSAGGADPQDWSDRRAAAQRSAYDRRSET